MLGIDIDVWSITTTVQLEQIFPTWNIEDLEALDKVITDRELEELLEAHGIESK
jgi:hypothetical protein